MKLAEIVAAIESHAPLTYQESYDNAGLAVGDPGMEVAAVLLCLDVTEEVISEAVQLGANVVISHHPVLFHPLKKLTGQSGAERIVLSALEHRIALYSAHTNLDNVFAGVNQKISQKLGLENIRILSPLRSGLKKLVTFVPLQHADALRMALFDSGCGHIGNYDCCSFNLEGQGSYRASEGTHPFTGRIGELHLEPEIRIETIFPGALQSRIISALLKVHPYEEVAYDIYPVENEYRLAGAGMIGELPQPMETGAFLSRVKKTFGCRQVKHSRLMINPVKRVAVCGGSGAFLISQAIQAAADVFITGELKYHQFYEADGRIVIADIGHFESEQFTIEIFYEILTKKLPNFAIHFSSIQTSPIYYL
jgi:dinuclear metal center YbgI/SA1388 family protein